MVSVAGFNGRIELQGNCRQTLNFPEHSAKAHQGDLRQTPRSLSKRCRKICSRPAVGAKRPCKDVITISRECNFCATRDVIHVLLECNCCASRNVILVLPVM